MSAIEIGEFKAKIEELLAAVERGETVEIVRGGVKVATLTPSLAMQAKKLKKPFPNLDEFRASQKVTKLEDSVRRLRDEERY